MSRPRLSGRATVVLASLVAILPAGVLAMAQEGAQPGHENIQSGQIDPVPSAEAIASSRLEAALQDRDLEQQRIAEADAWYAGKQDAGAVPEQLMVSFTQPASASAFFKATDADAAMKVEKVFTWMAISESVHPRTGEHAVHELGLSAEERADALVTAGLEYLRFELEGLTQYSPSDGLIKQQLELEQLIAELQSEGALLYGFECTCSPETMDRFLESNSLGSRAIEAAGDSQPLWPEDRLRDLVIESRGRYGR